MDLLEACVLFFEDTTVSRELGDTDLDLPFVVSPGIAKQVPGAGFVALQRTSLELFPRINRSGNASLEIT
jgi:hypothetical protein